MLAAVVAVVAVAGGAVALAGGKDDGFITARPSMLKTADMTGVEITPLLTVGDELPGGYMFEAIPDGIVLDPKGRDVDVWVNHETSKVPFPFSLTNPANNENDFDNAQLVVQIDQSADGGPTDKGPAPGSTTASIGNGGAWETTGIVDASTAFGKDMFLINVQAHTLWVDRARDLDNDAFAPFGTPDYPEKKEGGQLLLIKIPGAD